MTKNAGYTEYKVTDFEDGIFLRDHFAGLAMQGIYASPTIVRFADGTPAPDKLTNEAIAQIAYEQADAMLAERGKRDEN